MGSLLKTKKRSSNRSQVLLYAIGFFAFILLSIAVNHLLSKPSIDLKTSCIEERKSEVTVVVLDKTTTLKPSHIRAIRKIIDIVADRLATVDRFTLFEIDSERFNGLSKPIFDQCKPKPGKEADAIFENKTMIQKRFQTHFSDELEKVTESVIQNAPSNTSPIVESLMDLSILYELEPLQTLRKIILISDLLQHSKLNSFYSAPQPRGLSDDLLAKIPDLSGVEVHVYMIIRDGKEGKLQNNNLIQWWEDLFSRAGGILSITKVR